MDSSLFECPVCREHFDLFGRLPRRLLVCEHLVCSRCLTQILSHKNRSPRCPLNCSELPHKDLNEFPVCLIVRQILENRSKKEICQKHNKKINFICLNDKEKICKECLDSHSKENHQFRSLESTIKNTNESRQNIKQLAKDMTIFKQDIEKVIDERWQRYIKNLNQIFNEFRSLVNEKEQMLLTEANCYFESQKLKINDSLGENSELLKDLTEKESKLANIFNHEDLLLDFKAFDKIQKKIDDWKPIVNSKEIHKIFWDKLEQESKIFNENFLSAQTEFLSKIHLNGLELDECLIQNILMDLNDQIISNDPSNDINSLRANSILNFNLVGNCLEITTGDKHKEILIEIDKWNEVQKVKLTLVKALQKKDVTLLSRIWKTLRAIANLDFVFHPRTVSKTLTDIFSEEMNTCSSISIDISQYDADKCPEVLLLIKNILSKASNLDYLAFDASEVKFPVGTLKNIFKSDFFNGKKLKYFKLDLEQSNITDEDVETFFVEMPSLEIFVLNLSATKITDKALEICGKNILNTVAKLKELRLDFSRLWITDHGLDFVLKHFKSLTNLELILGETQITDKAIKLLSQRMSIKFKDLVEFRLDLAETKVSDKFFSSLFGPMPKLKKFGIVLLNTNITDKTIDLLVKKTLISMSKPLVYLELMLNGTNCTDKSLSGLLKNLDDIENLTLYLGCERISDTSIAPFVREKLPQMESLKKLELNVLLTSVSRQLKDEINSLKSRINGE